MKLHAVSFCVLLTLIFLPAQQAPKKSVEPSPPIPMPADRSDQSYAIYSQLMPGPQFRGDWPRVQWLIEDTTVATVLPWMPCQPANHDNSPDAVGNPHRVITAPAGRENDLAELLDDFDRHCHDRIVLIADQFKLPVPFRLLNKADQTEFIGAHFGPNGWNKADPAVLAKYKGAPGLSSFSDVYFNPSHSMAMVYTGLWSDGRSGLWCWLVLEFQDGKWQTLPWVHTLTVS